MNNEYFKLLEPLEHFFGYVGNGRRIDGRSLPDFRSISLQTDIISSSHGSALVHLGSTVAICAIKGEITDQRAVIGEILSKSEWKTRRVVVSVEGGTGCEGDRENEFVETAAVIQNLFNSEKIIDLNSLSLADKAKNVHWVLYVDVSILNSDGATLDACLLAVAAAVRSARLPRAALAAADDSIDDVVALPIGDELSAQTERFLARDAANAAASRIVTWPDDASTALRCVGRTSPMSMTFLVLTADDFRFGVKSKADCVILCDPSADERNLFPGNVMSLILSGSSDKNTLNYLIKYAGTSCIDESVVEQCFKLASSRKDQLDELMTDVLSS